MGFFANDCQDVKTHFHLSRFIFICQESFSIFILTMASLLLLRPFLGILLLTTLTTCISQEIETTTTLSNGKKLPLIGMGVGNLQHDAIVDMIALGSDNGIRLVDTAHASHNEALVNQGIEKSSTTETFHVITKVWYTHLGYERTKISVTESLQELHAPNVKVHMLLHWPRCRDDITWMDCEGEEERLPQNVKDAGPPPHLDKDKAFLESWRALEDMYDADDRIESIGISNFDLNDLKLLLSNSRITPHLLQGNVWTYLFDPYLMNFLKKHDVHFQAYNVMNGVLSQTSKAPNAYHSLVTVANEISQSQDTVATPAQVVLRWLVQANVSVIPRTSNPQHLQENAATLTAVQSLTSKQQASVKNAVAALLRGVDLDPPKVTFHNHANQVAHLFWFHSAEGTEVPVKEHLQPNESFESQTYPGHVFVAYDESKSSRREYEISASYGDAQEFRIEL